MGRYCRTRGQSRKPSYPFPSYPSYPCYPLYPSFPVLPLSRYRRPDFETGDQSRCRDRDPSCCWCSHCPEFGEGVHPVFGMGMAPTLKRCISRVSTHTPLYPLSQRLQKGHRRCIAHATLKVCPNRTNYHQNTTKIPTLPQFCASKYVTFVPCGCVAVDVPRLNLMNHELCMV